MKKRLLVVIFYITFCTNAQQIKTAKSQTYTQKISKALKPLTEKDAKLYKNSILYNKVMPLANLSNVNNSPKATAKKVESDVIEFVSSKPYRDKSESWNCNGNCFGKGEYKVYYSGEERKIKRPIIILDGFDPNDARKIDGEDGEETILGLINEGSEGKAMDQFAKKGYDVIFLNFPVYPLNTGLDCTKRDGGTDYIERNAEVLKTLIHIINEKLKINDSEEKLIIIGPSMGGLISRIALTQMEAHNINHNVDTWFSLDSPQLGANIPIGIQAAANFAADLGKWLPFEIKWLPFGITPLAGGKTKVISPAAQQMLLVQLDVKGRKKRRDFRAKLDKLGYPTKTRNVAIINGDIEGMYNVIPGNKIIDFKMKVFNTTNHWFFRYFFPIDELFTLNAHAFTPHITSTFPVIFQLYFDNINPYIPGLQDVKFMNSTFLQRYNDQNNHKSVNFDTSPGSYYDWSFGQDELQMNKKRYTISQNVEPFYFRKWVPLNFLFYFKYIVEYSVEVSLKLQKASFIPTWSALAYKGKGVYPDLAQNLSKTNLTCLNEIPFHNYFASNKNLEHIKLTPEMLNFISDELTLPYHPPAFIIKKYAKNLTISNVNAPIFPRGFAHAIHKVEGTNTIESGSNFKYTSNNEVLLKPPFHAQEGSFFRAYIQDQPCENETKKLTEEDLKNKFKDRDLDDDRYETKIDLYLAPWRFLRKEEPKLILTDETSFLTIYPNPNNGLFNIKSADNILFYSINNVFGKEIMFKKTNNKELSIDISKFSAGIYLLKLQMENGKIINKKILKR